ncbi:MAG TPA: SDR family oxidoreductase [Solirubrobacteraceae bacterium]|jgi:NAD(P)-dependent dehydrogenase (short-subunit alcohol dehydrogenase family)|nr:SDR family oxidoreductase [Solirubrobacteraceae bacterium]
MSSDSEHPPQTLDRPGHESEMEQQPRDEMRGYVGSGKLDGKAALITGSDSGIGRAVAVAFAKEGADVAISYLSEHEDARRTAELVEAEGRRAVLLPGDLSDEATARGVVNDAAAQLGRLDVLVNNIAHQRPVESFEEVSSEDWDTTFRTNVYSFFWCSHEAMKHLPDGGAIINTSSINGLRGNKSLIAYSATKGAVNALTYSLAQALNEKGIRVNAVAPGPVWTPLIPATMDEEKVQSFGQQSPMGRAAQPDEIAPSYVFFASGQLSSYYSGEILAPIGGETLPG